MKKERPPLYTHKKDGFFARITGWFIRKIFIRKLEYHFQGERPQEPSLLIGNHTKSFAPLATQYTYPDNVRTWSVAAFLDTKQCKELFRRRILVNIKYEKLFRFLLPLIAPFLVMYYKRHLNPIPIFRDLKILNTFNMSIKTLQAGSHIALYPELRDIKFNQYICGFETGFVYLAYNYYIETGKKLKFFPFYCAPALRQTHFGNPIEYNPDIPIKERAVMIAEYLQAEITRVAESLPPHRIISMMGDIFYEGA